MVKEKKKNDRVIRQQENKKNANAAVVRELRPIGTLAGCIVFCFCFLYFVFACLPCFLVFALLLLRCFCYCLSGLN